jgi:hypothetical protein
VYAEAFWPCLSYFGLFDTGKFFWQGVAVTHDVFFSKHGSCQKMMLLVPLSKNFPKIAHTYIFPTKRKMVKGRWFNKVICYKIIIRGRSTTSLLRPLSSFATVFFRPTTEFFSHLLQCPPFART